MFGISQLPPELRGYSVSLPMVLVWAIRESRLHQCAPEQMEFNLKLDGRPLGGQFLEEKNPLCHFTFFLLIQYYKQLKIPINISNLKPKSLMIINCTLYIFAWYLNVLLHKNIKCKGEIHSFIPLFVGRDQISVGIVPIGLASATRGVRALCLFIHLLLQIAEKKGRTI